MFDSWSGRHVAVGELVSRRPVKPCPLDDAGSSPARYTIYGGASVMVAQEDVALLVRVRIPGVTPPYNCMV